MTIDASHNFPMSLVHYAQISIAGGYELAGPLKYGAFEDMLSLSPQQPIVTTSHSLILEQEQVLLKPNSVHRRIPTFFAPLTV